jgi:hypothetical protein
MPQVQLWPSVTFNVRNEKIENNSWRNKLRYSALCMISHLSFIRPFVLLCLEAALLDPKLISFFNCRVNWKDAMSHLGWLMVEPVIGWVDEFGSMPIDLHHACLVTSRNEHGYHWPDLEALIKQRCPDYAYTGFVETLGKRKSSSTGPRKRHVQIREKPCIDQSTMHASMRDQSAIERLGVGVRRFTTLHVFMQPNRRK